MLSRPPSEASRTAGGSLEVSRCSAHVQLAPAFGAYRHQNLPHRNARLFWRKTGATLNVDFFVGWIFELIRTILTTHLRDLQFLIVELIHFSIGHRAVHKTSKNARPSLPPMRMKLGQGGRGGKGETSW